MNKTDPLYNKYALISEMLESAEVIANTNLKKIKSFLPYLKQKKILLAGEGSSRIFPAQKAIADALHNDYAQMIVTENCSQALEYALDKYTVIVASNSGRTREGLRLLQALKGHRNTISIVANSGTPIATASRHTYLLNCGKEQAVASTKSVIEQALFYDILFRLKNKKELPDLAALSRSFREVLEQKLPADLVQIAAKAETIYFSGRNNGVAEELALKTNEIARKRSDYLEGTYAVHGIEEVMSGKDLLIIIEPFEDTEEKFREVLEKGVCLPVYAIASRKTSFPTIIIPDLGEFSPYLQLAAGWNLLVEIGLQQGINLDCPKRARKIGNVCLENTDV